jgi:hypothetical protein
VRRTGALSRHRGLAGLRVLRQHDRPHRRRLRAARQGLRPARQRQPDRPRRKATFDKVPFEVVGRLQLRHGRGTWNEWFLGFADGSVGWLSDAQGSYAIVRPREKSIVAGKVPPSPPAPSASRSSSRASAYVPVERRAATYQGAEGSLPFPAAPGDRFYSVDLRGHDGEFMTLDYGERGDHQQPTLYMGRAVDLIAIGLQPLRKFAGWERRA